MLTVGVELHNAPPVGLQLTKENAKKPYSYKHTYISRVSNRDICSAMMLGQGRVQSPVAAHRESRVCLTASHTDRTLIWIMMILWN